jgi:uncharacterized protein
MACDIDNGRESTPCLRTKIIDTGNPFPKMGTKFDSTTFPPPGAKPLKLFLDNQNHSLSSIQPQQFQSNHKASKDITFAYTFLQDSILCGKVEMTLAISLIGSDDSDIFVTFEKVLQSGGIGSQLKIPYEKCYQTLLVRTVNRLGLAPDTKFLFYKALLAMSASHEGLLRNIRYQVYQSAA